MKASDRATRRQLDYIESLARRRGLRGIKEAYRHITGDDLYGHPSKRQASRVIEGLRA